jgi:hypothetical protein
MTELNKSLSAVMTIAQTLLQAESAKSDVTPALVADKVRLAALTLGNAYPDGIDQSAACAELIRRFSYWIGKDSSLENSQGHEPWLVASRKKDWRYWQRYQGFLERKIAVDVVAALDESTDRILALMEDPRRTGSWDRRGLVVGHVQSGKTGNYAGLVCKAADAGYKVIIVLAGLHNNLRSQTQIRLEESFLGYETSANRDPGKLVGVAEIDSDPNIHPHCATTRANNGDFNTRVARNFAISPEERPWLFVVKKNKSVLTRLLKWIQGHVADTTDAATRCRIVTRLPLLVIDDEADNASVDMGEQLFNADGTPADDHQPRAINGLIRKILHAFEKKAYVGYTATPFANIFIHRRNATTEEGHDLFPRSFIINLAAPSNYVGPARVFGLRTTEGRSGGLPLMRDVFDHVNQADSGGWMPPRHNKEHVPIYRGQETLPPSLYEAVASFVLATAARVCRGQGNEHSSMLIHVTRFVKVQHAVHGQVEATIKRMKQRLTRSIGHEELLCQLETLWHHDFVPVCADLARLVPEAGGTHKVPTWAEICAALPDVLSDIQVRMINGTAKDALDYAEHGEKGLKVIAIGGDKLARGLTLEGLCTSYFVRTTKMYDTLMQMGRWFGYRPGYVDLCRLYTTPELVEWFGHIADASEELREEFDTMVMSGATPEQYGLKVESHPVLVVTSPLKMRSAQTLRLSYSGSFVQTISFDQSPDVLGRNLDAANRMLELVGHPSETAPRRRRDEGDDHWAHSYLWKEVGAEIIIDFLRSYKTPTGADRANSTVLADFVSQMNKKNELTSWTLALLAEGRPSSSYTFTNGITVSTLPFRKIDRNADRYTIGVLTEPGDEAIDLDYPGWKSALDATQAAWKPDLARNRITRPTRPSGQKIRELRGYGTEGIPPTRHHGIILLYPLSPSETKNATTVVNEKPIIAFAMSFPCSETGVKVEYKVDHLYWEQEYGPSE